MAEPEHSSRDRHLFGPGPKRILALDGGGVRGVISVAFLERIEAVLKEQQGDGLLGDWFDLIGGTSTGAIVGCALALGRTTDELRDIYHRLAPKAFKRSFRVPLFQAKFNVNGLRREIAEVIGDRTLDTPDLRTGYALMAKRMDTGSPWIVSNNPRAPYWQSPPEKTYIGNRHYPLGNLVRASTAAPTYFEPESIRITDDDTGLFVDGGVSPHNNPSLALFMMSRLAPYGLNWETGLGKLTIVSVGTGGFRAGIDKTSAVHTQNVTLALHALLSVMDDTSIHALAMMQWMSDCPTPWRINSEIGAVGDVFPGGPLFRFLRYDVRLEHGWLEQNLDLKLSAKDLARVRQMDNPDSIPLAYEIGQMAAAQQVKAEHLLAGAEPLEQARIL